MSPLLALWTYARSRVGLHEGGAVAVEYLFLILGVALVMALGAAVLGGKLSAALSAVLP